MSSTTGTIFKITTFGESHGAGIGVVIDGCPAGMTLDLTAIQRELTRRRPGQSHLTTPRKEDDEFEVLSGLHDGKTLGTALTLYVKNTNARATDYDRWADIYRPSHADYTYDAKYGWRTPFGGGRASVRETIGRVAAGAVAAQILENELGARTIAWVDSIGTVKSGVMNSPPADRAAVDASLVRCPDPAASEAMIRLIEKIKKEGDSIGGTIGAVVTGVPPGLGDPVFDKLEADLAKACLSIPACKGFESGSGFAGTERPGSQNNDEFLPADEPPPGGAPAGPGAKNIFSVPRLRTRTNHSGGIQGGISNGMPITLRLAFKSTATIHRPQQSVNEAGEAREILVGGRHDPCVLPRAVPIVEAVINLTLVDAYLRQRATQPDWWLRYRNPPPI